MVTMILISVEVLTIIAVFARKGLPTDPVPLVFFGASGVWLTVLLVRFLRSAHPVARSAGMSA